MPENITLLPLPPRASPDQVRGWLWAYLRANKLAITVFDSYHDIVTAC